MSENTWHLAENEEEMNVTEFELLLWRVFHGFLRWQEDCELATNGATLTGNELSILHIVRMKNKPKTTTQIAQLLNREDMFNINYSVKKLLKLGLIEKSKGSVKKGATYQITEAGIKDTDNFIKARKRILITLFKKETRINLPKISQDLAKIISIYDGAAKIAAFNEAPSLK
ncbi:MAG: winged helix DNA-binding protein [Gammaproteobacteria bacterium]|nr:winged helix DNA-binding protein [Gammaproteobacteria bacterium]